MTDRSILTAADWRARHIAGSPPKILRDLELKEFVDGLLPTRTFGEIAERAREHFGRTRAPSRAAVGRYWQRLTDPDGPDIALGGAVHGRARECLWCGAQLKTAAQQRQKRFCADRCRMAMHAAARRWAVEAVIDGRLSVAELRRHAPSTKEN